MAEIDITKHRYVPKHIKMSEQEVTKLLERFNITKRQLPKILKNDPAIKHLNPKPGDVIKIIRESPTAKESEYYRVVVER